MEISRHFTISFKSGPLFLPMPRALMYALNIGSLSLAFNVLAPL